MEDNKSVLLIDDDHELADAISAFLCLEDYTVYRKISGAEGIQVALEKNPGVIMLDWQMPDMNGEQVLALIRANATLQMIPLILMSAHVEEIPNEILETYPALSKPFDPDLMLELVAQSLMRR